MITKNGKYLFGTMNNSNITLQLIDGNTDYEPKSSWFGYPYIAVGSGSTAPTTSDWKLESKINSLTVISNNSVNPTNYNSYMFSIQTTYKNNTNENITIREVGIVTGAYSGYDDYKALIVREVLDAPVVIKPQKSYTFSITI